MQRIVQGYFKPNLLHEELLQIDGAITGEPESAVAHIFLSSRSLESGMIEIALEYPDALHNSVLEIIAAHDPEMESPQEVTQRLRESALTEIRSADFTGMLAAIDATRSDIDESADETTRNALITIVENQAKIIALLTHIAHIIA